MTSSPDPKTDPENPDFEQALLELEESFQALKNRYNQIQHDQQRKIELQQQQQHLKQQLRQNRSASLHQELQQLQQQLEAIELNLESSLFSWGSLKEPFWQAVRFGGLGIIVGWILKSCTS